MLSKERKAEIARENGAKSRGPKTEQGKACSRRNAITHGRTAVKVSHFVAPDSALLANENRQEFYQLYDEHLVKYRPADKVEQGIVRKIVELEWVNIRINSARHALLNRELRLHEHNVDSQSPAVATAIAYESADRFKTMTKLRQEHDANTRQIALLERRLKLLQQTWPAAEPQIMNTSDEHAQQPKRTDASSAQTVENAGTMLPDGSVLISTECALTPELIAFYRKLYPNRDLTIRTIGPGDEL